MREIRSLTSLRGLAAVYVALLHFSTLAQTLCLEEIPSLAPRGQLAVDFFFDLSGFVMGYTYYAVFASEKLGMMPLFLLKRVARIWPLHAAVLGFMVVYTLIVSPSFSGGDLLGIKTVHPVRDISLNFLLLHGLGIAPNFNGPSWSISTEFLAYLIFPLFIVLVFGRSALLRLASIAIPVAGLWAITYDQPRFNLGQLATGLAIVRTFAGFALGLVAYRCYRERKLLALASDGAFAALSVAILAIMVFRLGDIFAAMLFPFAILAAAYNQGAMNRALGSPVLHFLGVVSYSIYLLHEVIGRLELGLIRSLHPTLFAPEQALAFAAVGALSVIPPAWVAYRLIERPGRDAVRALGDWLAAIRQGLSGSEPLR